MTQHLRNSGDDSLLMAIHVNHCISPSANTWEKFCLDYCAKLNIECISIRVDVQRNSRAGLEAAARQARYEVFDSIDADRFLLAHHQDDQAETMLFNLLRGTGLAGASAMRERNGRYLRPWLGISRSVIERYAVECRLTWCEDESNSDVRHSRNFLRQNITPLLESRFPAGLRNLSRAAGRFAEALELLDELARIDSGGQNQFPIEVERLAALSESRARNVFRYLLSKHGVQIPGEARLNETVRQMLEAGDDRHPASMFGKHRLFRRRGRIYLDPAEGSCESR
jgi:tRNA(Ile)-lysidine synthase